MRSNRLLRSATDARSVAIRARAEIAQGRYAEAEKLLTPVANAQPGSDAALELGLLHMQLGRRNEGVRVLRLIIARTGEQSAAISCAWGRPLARSAHSRTRMGSSVRPIVSHRLTWR
jgi:Flp pilus assembly protein TadD